jgi:hypothetical protein
MSERTSTILREYTTGLAMESREFRAALIENPQATLEAKLGGDVGYEVCVHEERAGEFLVLVPTQLPDMEERIETILSSYQGGTPTRTQFEAMTTKKCWNEEGFLDKLTTDGRNVLNTELDALCGTTIPADTSIAVITEGHDEVAIVLPRVVGAESGNLSDDELESVAGGADVSIAATVATTIIATIVANTVNNTIGVSAFDTNMKSFGSQDRFNYGSFAGSRNVRNNFSRGGTYRF